VRSPHATVIIGTRPEAIKLAPVIIELRRRAIKTTVIGTGQHRDLLDSVLALFEIVPDHDLLLMEPDAGLNDVLGRAVERIGAVLGRIRPDLVVVQGDTTSALAGALAAFNLRIPVAHVEAGLRSHDLSLPFPEEMHRMVVSIVSRWNFAPTEHAAHQLRSEGQLGKIAVTGNTVVDAVRQIVHMPGVIHATIAVPEPPYLLATAHRRESWGRPIRNIALGLRDVLRARREVSLIFATHPNPLARRPVEEALRDEPRALVVGALEYREFLTVLQGAVLAITDSGGIQEEGPTLGIPVLVTRAVTERPEGLASGAVRMVGTTRAAIRGEVERLLDDDEARAQMAAAGRQVYGDGQAARRIVDALERDLPGVDASKGPARRPTARVTTTPTDRPAGID
jgi:UDP-N-acetylglucosamine 2-epimerase (non-hydrolysing)